MAAGSLERDTHLLGLLVVCLMIWQKTSSRSSAGACRHVLSTFSAWPASSLLELRSPMKPVTLRNSCADVAEGQMTEGQRARWQMAEGQMAVGRQSGQRGQVVDGRTTDTRDRQSEDQQKVGTRSQAR